MKKWCMFGSLLAVLSCAVAQPQVHPYVGEWILESKSGGFEGKTILPDAEYVLKITADSIFSYKDCTLIDSQTFIIKKGKCIHSTEPQDTLQGLGMMRTSIALKNDRLILAQQCNDCFVSVYKRK